ncbi:MAG: Flp pilus assembly complex ATPase component TadA [Polaromonas sp.]|nr:Flp pilus assembly complex ATPase component TadA [Polaromonas sp.]
METHPAPEPDDLSHYLSLMVAHGATDLFLSSGAPPSLKIQGQLKHLPKVALGAMRTKALAYSVMRDAQVRQFEAELACDLAIALDQLGRFRINVYLQRGDVIMIGEIRDQSTMQHAMAYAETGHLCVSTLHANNANQAIQRILNFFPETAHRQVLMDLSLKGVVGQRLLRGHDGKRVPAIEVMLLSPYIADLIQKGKTDEIKAAMAQSVASGMATFDQSLYALYTRGDISQQQAIEQADSKTDLSPRIRLASARQPATDVLHVLRDWAAPQP